MPDRRFALSKEVAGALRRGRPVVALESTLITHGLPHPVNVKTALAMEAAVRESGAVPATIAVLAGQITVGLSPAEIERLGARPAGSVRKCSRRDLPIAVARGDDGATTVAGTIIVAHWAGIRVFATGGIGGVHRGQPFDVSADLLELGRTPVAVVCAGAKSVLDVPLTLEVLETQGVPVVGLGTKDFPGFYARSSGLPVDVAVDTPQEAAAIVAAAARLGAAHGVLIATPVPAAAALAPERVAEAVAAAEADARSRGIRGKALTPFLLKQVARLTGDASLRANLALLENNARVAGRIAVALSESESGAGGRIRRSGPAAQTQMAGWGTASRRRR